jgi:glucosamine--fructose-6-phosphate aminotransferase (isomerizing)
MMMEPGEYTYQEIQSQPDAWAAVLDQLKQMRTNIEGIQPLSRFDQIIFTGCGSTYYLSMAAAALNQELTGLPCRAFPASELWHYPLSSYTHGKTLLVAVSRSGETTETLYAGEAFLEKRIGELLTLSCYPDQPLAKMGAFNLVLPSGQERSVAQTRAFSTLYLATVALGCLWAGSKESFSRLSQLSEDGRRILKNYAGYTADLGADPGFDRFYWLGSGPRHGLACELSLKMKEMSLTHSEPFHFMEFRHGPKSMVTPTSLVIGLRSTTNGSQEAAVLKDVKDLGGRKVDIAESGSDVRFESGLKETLQNILFLPVGQMIAYARSISKCLNPDHPTNLDSVVRLS